LYNNKNNVYRNESLTFSFMDVTPTNYSRKMHVFIILILQDQINDIFSNM